MSHPDPNRGVRRLVMASAPPSWYHCMDFRGENARTDGISIESTISRKDEKRAASTARATAANSLLRHTQHD